MQKKKKTRTAPSLPHTGQVVRLTSNGYQRMIKAELHKLNTPVTHIDPQRLPDAYYTDLIQRAQR